MIHNTTATAVAKSGGSKVATPDDTPFRFVESLLTTKQYQLNTEYDVKQYPSFFVNRALSQHIDCIFHVNAMDLNHHIPGKWAYDYLFHAVRKMKRPRRKWGKKIKDDNIQLIMDYYGYGYNKARQILPVLTDAQLKKMKASMEVGG